ncbi:UNVERIFIED_CONTAM: Retrovirus-related Pol polyprotein from transposon RE2 [Sesamum calycinum]|uniref:Retrovirus-related Pol polyprotein from transposon RE2 n=1 Tax=Sesamum calycinum TaxID=2727403 RepID=A0AAW2NJD3_9LAMI
MKLGYINSKIPKPSEDSEEFEQWNRADCIVTLWLLNSISKDIIESFLCVNLARELWQELETRFWVSNGPMVYQIQREISSISQGTLSISAYYNKVKKLWELLPSYSCGASKEMANLHQSDQLMQFLMGLSECYDHIRNKILMMDPLQSVTNAYAMVLLCGKTRHLKDTCFEIHGYPDWYKSLMEQRKKDKAGSSRAFCTEEFEISQEESIQNVLDNNNVSDTVRMELIKLIREMNPQNSIEPDLEEFDDYAGRVVGKLYVLDDSSFKQETVNKFQQHLESVALNLQTVDIDTWHRRLGHTSVNVLHHLTFTNKAESLKICEVCPQAKRHRLMFPLSRDHDPVTCTLPVTDHGQDDFPNTITQCTPLVPNTHTDTWDIRNTQEATIQNLRGSTRTQTKPAWIQDFYCRYSQDLTSRCNILQWHIHQVDINNALLHGYIKEDIYMVPPEGYSVPLGHVCKLRRSLYGLKQASWQWDVEFTLKLETYGFHQSKHDHCLFTKSGTSGLQHSKATTTPLRVGIKFAADAGSVLPNPEQYRRLVERLLYFGFSRPNISHASQQLSQFMQVPCQQHWDVALHLLKYLKGTTNKRLFFPSRKPLELKAYGNVDWAACLDTMRSLTRYCVFLEQALISWKIKKQNTVSRSSAEAEYRSLATTACELFWIYNLLQDMTVLVPTPIPFFCDNQVALHILANPVFHERTKHLETDCHLVRDKYKEGFLLPSHVSSKL